MAALPKNPKKGQTVSLKAETGPVKATWNGKSWDYKSQPAAPPKRSAPGSVNSGKPAGAAAKPAEKPAQKPSIMMTRGEQDRAAAAASVQAIADAKSAAARRRTELLHSAYEDQGLTASGNRTNKQPGIQPRDSELATLRENAKKEAAGKYKEYLNESAGPGQRQTRAQQMGLVGPGPTAPSGSNATSTQAGAAKAFGPTRKQFSSALGKGAPNKNTVLERATKAFAGSDPKLAGIKDKEGTGGMGKASDAFSKTSLTKDEFNRFKNVYKRKHKGEVSDTYLQVMARYVKSKGTKTKAFGTYKFKGS